MPKNLLYEIECALRNGNAILARLPAWPCCHAAARAGAARTFGAALDGFRNFIFRFRNQNFLDPPEITNLDQVECHSARGITTII